MTLHSGTDPAATKQERFMALLTPCLAQLSRYAHALAVDAEDGRDLLSDAILLAFEQFDKLKATEAFRSYMFITVRRLFYRRERRKKLWSPITEATEAIADARSNEAEVRLDSEALDRALAKLPEAQREAIILFEISGLSLSEIQKIQGGSLSGVKSRIQRGRERLKELLLDPKPVHSNVRGTSNSSMILLRETV